MDFSRNVQHNLAGSVNQLYMKIYIHVNTVWEKKCSVK